MKSKVVYCWNCKTALDIKGSYYQCSSCGATWNELPTLGEFIDIERHRGAQNGGMRYQPVKKRVRVAVKPTRRTKR